MATDPRLNRLDPRRTATPPQPPPPPPPQPQPQQQQQADQASTPVENGAANGSIDTSGEDEPYKLRFCTVCASNQNRSMEAHLRLSLAAYPVISFGTGSCVRLPGPSITEPNVYPFNTVAYSTMFNELKAKDPRLYRSNGLLDMLERNLGVKETPERWQDWPVGTPRLSHMSDRGAKGVEGGLVDIVITCEERCWDAVVENLVERGSPLNHPVHVINVDIKDNHQEALVGGKAIVDLADTLNEAARVEREIADSTGEGNGFDERVPELIAEWQERWPTLPALWTLFSTSQGTMISLRWPDETLNAVNPFYHAWLEEHSKLNEKDALIILMLLAGS